MGRANQKLFPMVRIGACRIREHIRGALQLGDRPMVAMTEQTLPAIGSSPGLGVNGVIPGRHEISKVDGCSLQLSPTIKAFELVDECDKRVRDPAGCPVLRPFDDAWFDPLTTPRGMPLKSSEAIYCEPHCGDVFPINSTFRRSSGIHSLLLATWA